MVATRNQGYSRGTSHENIDRQTRADATVLRHLGVGIDTARFGHHVRFLGTTNNPLPNRCRSPNPATVTNSCNRSSRNCIGSTPRHLHLRIDAAGGVFPQELQSGVDKFGRPSPPGKKIMCRKGNDLVRGLLWQCAKCAAAENGGNPAVRALYLRRLAAGDTPQIAWGYCMTKLLRQVFGVWSSGQPFDPQHET